MTTLRRIWAALVGRWRRTPEPEAPVALHPFADMPLEQIIALHERNRQPVLTLPVSDAERALARQIDELDPKYRRRVVLLSEAAAIRYEDPRRFGVLAEWHREMQADDTAVRRIA